MNNTLKLYKYTDKVGYLKESYCNQMIHLSPLTELNDPFEGYSIIKQFPPNFVINNPVILEIMLSVFQEHQPSITKKEVIDLIQSDGFKSGLEKYEDMRKNYFTGFGVTSFSSDPANLPMWAYYAGDHRGYCVEFEMDIDYIQKKNTNLAHRGY